MNSINLSSDAFGCVTSQRAALMTSLRLCEIMFVAIPTAIPEAPLTSRFGNAAGSTSGSDSFPAKFGL